MDFTATVNSEVFNSVSFVCPTQNGKQNNLSQPVSLQSLLSHTTDTSYVLFPEVHYVSNLPAFREKNKRRQEVQNWSATLGHEILKSRKFSHLIENT